MNRVDLLEQWWAYIECPIHIPFVANREKFEIRVGSKNHQTIGICTAVVHQEDVFFVCHGILATDFQLFNRMWRSGSIIMTLANATNRARHV